MKAVVRFTTFVTLSLMAVAAQAGDGVNLDPTVTWEGVAATIPTLGTWGLVALALMFGVMGSRLLKGRSAAVRTLSVVVISGGMLLGGQAAHTAVMNMGLNISGEDDCMAGGARYKPFNPLELQNDCPNPVTITDYNFDGIAVPICTVLQETCPVGTTIAPGSSCTLNWFDNSECDF